MPQMKPLNWLWLFLSFLLIILFSNLLNFFNFSLNPSFHHSLNNSNLLNSYNWKW